MRTNGLTWVGLTIVLLGWALLIADLAVSDTVLRAGNLVAIMALRADILTVAQTAIVTGLGLAILGALRSGFGAFAKFFDAVLQRSASPRATAVPTSAAPAPVVGGISPLGDRPRPPPMPTPPFKEPNYVILSDGSVEVETMFGTRVFATMDEARDFIR